VVEAAELPVRMLSLHYGRTNSVAHAVTQSSLPTVPVMHRGFPPTVVALLSMGWLRGLRPPRRPRLLRHRPRELYYYDPWN
jgi:hypothetical protein